MRVLDEVADAIRIARGCSLPVRTSVALADVFPEGITAGQWWAMEKHLDCPLPPLRHEGGRWYRTDDFASVWDLVEYVARHHPDWELPAELTSAAWRNAQVFAGVRAVVTDSFGISAEEVTRQTRFIDLD
jgi:hypothetical protein